MNSSCAGTTGGRMNIGFAGWLELNARHKLGYSTEV